jgi:hypothetical protein
MEPTVRFVGSAPAPHRVSLHAAQLRLNCGSSSFSPHDSGRQMLLPVARNQPYLGVDFFYPAIRNLHLFLGTSRLAWIATTLWALLDDYLSACLSIYVFSVIYYGCVVSTTTCVRTLLLGGDQCCCYSCEFRDFQLANYYVFS